MNMHPWRNAVKIEAEKWVGKVGGLDANQLLRGHDILIDIYKKAGLTETSIVRAWIPDVISGIKRGRWVRKQPFAEEGGKWNVSTSVDTEGIAWCGIFATWVLKHCGWKLHWANRQMQSVNGDIKRYPQPGGGVAWRDLIDVGDIIVVGDNNHHCVVTGTSPGSDSLSTVEGNLSLPLQAIDRRSQTRGKVHTMYKLSDL